MAARVSAVAVQRVEVGGHRKPIRETARPTTNT
jgi:hypothetical protein